jgi:hypothetical protein
MAGQSSSLTVTGLSATTTNPLNVTVTGTAQTQTSNVTVTVFLSDFSVSVLPVLANIAAGQAATYTITVTPINGFNQVVQLGVSGLPQATTAVLNPPAVTALGAQAVTSLVTLTTTVQTTRLWWPFPDSWVHPRSPVFRLIPLALFLAALALLVALVASGTEWMPTRKRAPAAVCVAMLLFFAVLLASCNDYPTTPPISPQISGTPYGVFTITVTGTMCIVGPCTGSKNGSVTRLTTMNLSVGP